MLTLPPAASSTQIHLVCSHQLSGWLQSQQISLACTTHSRGHLWLLSGNPAGSLSVAEQRLPQAQGLFATAERLYVGDRHQIHRFDHLRGGQSHSVTHALFAPRLSYRVGALGIEDLVAVAAGSTPEGCPSAAERLLVASSQLNCLVAVEQERCFPVWKPPFISRLVPEDRCHLSGLAVVEGQPRYVTIAADSDVAGGWRDRRHLAGKVLEVPSGEVVLSELSMPRLPRWVGDRLWLVNAGTGELGTVDINAGQFEPVAFCPGVVQGLAIWRDWAIVSLSAPATFDVFHGLPIAERLAAQPSSLHRGLQIIHLKTGQVEHWLRLENPDLDLGDLQVLPGVQQANFLDFDAPASTQRWLQQMVQEAPLSFGSVAVAQPASPSSTAIAPVSETMQAQLQEAIAQSEQGNTAGAIARLRELLAIAPTWTLAATHLAQLLESQGDLEAAADCYEQAMQNNPAARHLHWPMQFLRMRLCDWRNYDRRCQDLIALVQDVLDGKVHAGPNTFALNFFPVPPELHKALAQMQARLLAQSAHQQKPVPFDHRRRLSPQVAPKAGKRGTGRGFARDTPERGDRLRIGYLSPDLNDHAVGRLIFELFQNHDRDQFEIYAYSISSKPADSFTHKIQQGCDQFVDLSALSAIAAAQKIYDDRVDILIDLAGYTSAHRTDILAFQPAPVQAQFLGYPDTMGAEFVPYLLADQWIVPPALAEHYTERVIYLPHAFFGSPLGVSPRTLTRQTFGLPAEGFVFACFNTHHKITPDLVDAWGEILRRVPNSVLWMTRAKLEPINANLRRELRQRGIAENRIIFSPPLPQDEYLARYQCVDLFLDTFTYSAGSTAIACFWGGAPMLTRPGKTNASRMGASICAAAHLEELICPTTRAYIEKAIHLATHPQECQALRDRLQSERDTLPLFDVAGFARTLEAAFHQMWHEQIGAIALPSSGLVSQKYLDSSPQPLLNSFSKKQNSGLNSVSLVISTPLSRSSHSQYSDHLVHIQQHGEEEFFSKFNKILNILHYFHHHHQVSTESFDLIVDWTLRSAETRFGDGDALGENIWDRFFQPLSPRLAAQYRTTQVCQDYLDPTITAPFLHLLLFDPQFQTVRSQYATLCRQYIHLQPDVQSKVDRFVAEQMQGRTCIGVHKRHRLQEQEEFYLQAVPTAELIALVQQSLPADGSGLVLLVSEEPEAIAAFQAVFGDRLLVQPGVARQGSSDTEALHFQTAAGSPSTEAQLIDALLLSRCQMLVHGISDLTTAAAFFNPDLRLVYAYRDGKQTSRYWDVSARQFILGTDTALPRSTAYALFERGELLRKQGCWEAAVACFESVIRYQPDFLAAHNNLGTLFQNRRQMDRAEACYERVLQLNPNFVEAIANRALIWQSQGKLELARVEFERAVQLKPELWYIHWQLGMIYKQQVRLEGAIAHFQQVLAHKPDHADAHFQLAQILEYTDQLDGATAHYEQALTIDPKADYVKIFLNFARLHLCCWENYDQNVQNLVTLVEAGLQGNVPYTASPYALNFFPIPPELHLASAQKQARQFQHQVNLQPLCPLHVPTGDRPAKLRIGYISPDLRDHAVGRLVYQIFQQHDRDRYEVYAYATTEIYDAITEQIERGCDRFTRLSTDPCQAAQQIRQDDIHILIDLAGYTVGAGAFVLAWQPAPIQAQFMGYPNTMGAEFMQYALTDAWLTPPEIAAHYTETIIELPHAFVGSALGVSDRPMSRDEFGLPPNGFVFACFNTHRKINPEVFEAWMEILRRVPDSILWLSAGHAQAQANLQREAQQRGIDPQRLIFSPKLSYAEYLARYQLVDLFLDTFIYSAGSTAIAALWGGAPLLTRPGATNATRMGASICAAAELQELICSTTEEYIAKAVYLATHPENGRALRDRLQHRQSQLPLFDIGRFTRSLEAAFEHMWMTPIDQKTE